MGFKEGFTKKYASLWIPRPQQLSPLSLSTAGFKGEVWRMLTSQTFFRTDDRRCNLYSWVRISVIFGVWTCELWSYLTTPATIWIVITEACQKSLTCTNVIIFFFLLVYLSSDPFSENSYAVYFIRYEGLRNS